VVGVKFKFYVIALLILMFGYKIDIIAQTESKTPKIKASATPLQTTIGVQIQYKVSIAANDQTIEILLPEEKSFYLKDDKVSEQKEKNKKSTQNESEEDQDVKAAKKSIPLYRIESVVGEDNSDNNMLYKTVIMKVVYYHIGKYSLPEIKFKNSEGKYFTYQIPQVTINQLNKIGQMEDIEAPLALKGNYDRLIIIIISAILLGVVVAISIVFIRKKIKARKAKVTIRSPREVFVEELDKFKKEKYLEKNDVENFVVNLSMIFRRFLKLTLMIDAVDMTNDEIFRTIKKSDKINFSIDMYEKITDLMNLWDLSKFAEFAPSCEVLAKNLQDAESFVLEQNWQEVYKGA
jgi:hypothetical protein